MYRQNNQAVEQNRSHLKTFLKSPLTLVLGILFSIAAIMSVVFIVNYSDDLSDTFEALSYSLQNLFLYLGESSELFDIGTIFVLICAVTSPLTLAIAFIAMFLSSQNSNPAISPKGGAAALLSGAVDTMTGMFFIVMMIIVSLVELFSKAGGKDLGDELTSYIIRLLVLATSYILYSIGLIIFSSSVSKQCNSTRRSAGGAVLLGVGSIMVALVYMLFIIDTTSEGDDLNDIQSLLITTLAFSAVTYIVTAVFAFLYNSHMHKAPEFSFNSQPPKSAPAAAPYAEAQGYGDRFNGDTAPIPRIQQPMASRPVPQQPATRPPAPTNPATHQLDDATRCFTPIKEHQSINNNIPIVEHQPIVPRTAVRKADDTPPAVPPVTAASVVSGDVPAFCPECGASTGPDQMFCAACGTRL